MKTFNLELLRLGHKPSSTIGVLYWIKSGELRQYECVVLEDEDRDENNDGQISPEEKVLGATRIPPGKYEIKINNSPTPMTKRYQQKFDWFKYHLELQNVPLFKRVYIHIGNFANEATGEDDTKACLLVGETPAQKDGEFVIWNSTTIFKKFYQKVYPALEKGDRFFITIVDLDK